MPTTKKATRPPSPPASPAPSYIPGRSLLLGLALAALAGCGDNTTARPVACGRWDLNVGLECAEVPGAAPGDVYVDTEDGVSVLVVHDCAVQCSPYRTLAEVPGGGR